MEINNKPKWRIYNAYLLEYSIYAFVITYLYTIRLSNAVALVMFFFALLSNPLQDKWSKLKSRKELLLHPLYFILICIGVLYSTDRQYGVSFIDRSIPFFLMSALLGTSEFDEKKIVPRISLIFVLNIVVAAMYCLLQNVIFFQENHLDFKHFFDWEYAYEHLSDMIGLHPTYFSIAVLVAIIILIALPGITRLWQKIVRVLLVMFLSFFIILLGSKICIVILFVYSNVALLVYLKRKKNLKAILFYVLTNVALFTIAFNTHVIYWRFVMTYKTIVNTFNGSGQLEYRFTHWKCAAYAVSQKPIWGWGTADSSIPLNECYRATHMTELLDYNAHNQYLDTWVKLGLPGLGIVFLCLALPFYVAVRRGDYAMAAIFSVYLVVALTECIFTVQKGILLHSFITSIYFGHICILAKKRDPSSPL
ncbi:MAG TPA: O-antigen ligase family protein [Chryseolinea sp.]